MKSGWKSTSDTGNRYARAQGCEVALKGSAGRMTHSESGKTDIGEAGMESFLS